MPTSPEKILGVLGGMGPAATAEFLRLLAAYAPAERDQEHPKVFMLSDPGVPDRTAAILDGGEQPTLRLKKGLFTLADWGADLLAVPCNTAHFFIDQFGEKLPIPLVHIVEATLTEAKKRNPEGSWLVGTSGTQASGIYQSGAEKFGYPLYVPSADVQVMIQTAITLVKANRIDAAERQLRFALRHLWNRRDLPIVAACTEVPLAYIAGASPPEKMISSLEALALSCLQELYDPQPPL